jgi:hypothetical protein
MASATPRNLRGALALALVTLLPALAACRPVAPVVPVSTAPAAPAAPAEPTVSAATAPTAGDGLTAATAGASCWGVKRAFPSSPSGTYWLLTPAMDRPAQFWCDQVTGGGGWVLIGRGRDSWNFNPAGQGGAALVRTKVDGTGAFAAAALDTDTITGLIDAKPLSSLSDGVRVERATTTTGSGRQDLRLYPSYATWTWALSAGQRLAKIVIDGRTYANGNTHDTYDAFYDFPRSSLQGLQGTSRMMTWAWKENAYKSGFGMGKGVTGSTSGSSYLYRTSTGYALPFSRVWLRPKFANESVAFTAIPAAGYPADPNRANLKSRTEKAPWGVVGLNHTGEEATTPWYTPANVIKAYGSRIFVGGRFTHVQQGPTGARTAQGSLAAFDLDGNWISTFRPVIAGRVWDLTQTADGKLIVAGDFTSVNGQPLTSGVAALDPLTGQLVPGWRAGITRSTGAMLVRALDSRGTTIYAAGRFNGVQGGGGAKVTVSSAVSLSTATGAPGGWKPILTGTAVKVRAAAAGDRVYLAGYFNAVNGDARHGYHAITSASTGAPVPGMGAWQASGGSVAKYQQAVAEAGTKILVGGSEHDFQWYDRNRTKLLDSTITKNGGDTQTIEVFGNDVYMGCHCDQWVFEGTNNWDKPAGFRAASLIMLVGRFDATTMRYDPTWYPSALRGSEGDGVWSVTKDSRGCLWVAGHHRLRRRRLARRVRSLLPHRLDRPHRPHHPQGDAGRGHRHRDVEGGHRRRGAGDLRRGPRRPGHRHRLGHHLHRHPARRRLRRGPLHGPGGRRGRQPVGVAGPGRDHPAARPPGPDRPDRGRAHRGPRHRDPRHRSRPADHLGHDRPGRARGAGPGARRPHDHHVSGPGTLHFGHRRPTGSVILARRPPPAVRVPDKPLSVTTLTALATEGGHH